MRCGYDVNRLLSGCLVLMPFCSHHPFTRCYQRLITTQSLHHGRSNVLCLAAAAALFLEFWKRYSAEITHRWDLTGFDVKEEHPRPEYLTKLKDLKQEVSALSGVVGLIGCLETFV